MMDNWNQQVFDMIGRCRTVSTRTSRAAAIGKECPMIVSDNPDWNRGRQSKAASVKGIDKARVIAEFMTRQVILTKSY